MKKRLWGYLDIESGVSDGLLARYMFLELVHVIVNLLFLF